jgi:hypothetical protein
MGVFRVVFGLACCLKFFVETRRGYFSYLDPQAYLHGLWSARHSGRRFPPTAYKALYALKVVAAIGLVVGGPLSTPFALILAAWFYLEGRILFKFHVNLFVLLAAAIAAAPASACVLSPACGPGLHLDGRGPVVGQWLAVVSISALYLFGALHKAVSSEARSGEPLFKSLQLVARDRNQATRADQWWPPRLFAYLVRAPDETLYRRWRPLMAAVIGIQVVIPFLLLHEPSWLVGCALGLLLHGAITATLPATLAHFGLAVVATYPLFLTPEASHMAIAAFLS